jgi:2-polyprenyl-6-methoxyphenol hydroxylase-like FAD-dependent oxidoreductase
LVEAPHRVRPLAIDVRGEDNAGVFECEVVVAGGGPVGCWLAAELKTAGIDVVVLEKRAERDPHSKALTVLPRTLELFAMRGIAERWLETGTPVPSSHFALMNTRLDFSFLDTRYPYALFFPQARTTELLEEHASSLGVPLVREHTVTGATQDDDGVTVAVETPAGPATFRACYAVGCEGRASPVRKSAGIDLVGSPTSLHFVMGDVVVPEPPNLPTLSLNSDAGAFFMVRLDENVFRMAPFDLATMHEPREQPPTLEELRAAVRRVAGTDYGMHTARWLTHWGNATLQAARYRAGRLLLVGDSAYLFSPLGGQGLNLGLQDATNLAWKLAARIRGLASDDLLDTYHAERHPVGAEVVEDTLAQMALVASSTREGRALRRRFEAILGTHTSVNRELALRLSGLATAYRPPGSAEHPLIGQRIPDLDLQRATTPSVFGLLTSARFVLLDLAGSQLRLVRDEMPTDRLEVVTARLAGDRPDWAKARALLIRPDGHIAWATNDPTGVSEQAQAALSRWLEAREK